MTSLRIALAAVAVAAAAPALAALAVPASVEELARASDAVVRGRVVSVKYGASLDGKRIHTAVEVETASAWRGSAPQRVTVVVPGGALGRYAQKVAGAPQFAVGEDVVLFLARAGPAGSASFHVNGLAQGKFTVTGAQASPDLSETSLVSRRALRAGERRVEAMGVDELERRVRAAQ